MLSIENIIPKEITKDIETNDEIASFSYYDGIKFAEKNGLTQAINFKQLCDGTHFIVCCGDVMVKIKSEDYPEIKRRYI